jgi:hypothetical protein
MLLQKHGQLSYFTEAFVPSKSKWKFIEVAFVSVSICFSLGCTGWSRHRIHRRLSPKQVNGIVSYIVLLLGWHEIHSQRESKQLITWSTSRGAGVRWVDLEGSGHCHAGCWLYRCWWSTGTVVLESLESLENSNLRTCLFHLSHQLVDITSCNQCVLSPFINQPKYPRQARWTKGLTRSFRLIDWAVSMLLLWAIFLCIYDVSPHWAIKGL